MGRVYNALVRSERFQDTDRPIGRPERNGAGTGSGEGALGFSRDASSAAAVPFVFEDNFALTEDLASTTTTTTYRQPSASMGSTEVSAAVRVPALLARQ